MKEDELRRAAVCAACRTKIGASMIPMFFRVQIQRYALNMPAIQRQQGLTLMLGGSAELANVMGPNEDLAKTLRKPETVTLCMACISEPVNLAALMEDEDDEPEGEGDDHEN